MTGDTFKKVNSADPLRIPARTYNAFIDAAQAHRQSRRNVSVAHDQNPLAPGLILARNDSGQNVPRFGVLGIDGGIFDPLEDSLASFQNHVALACSTPSLDAGHTGKLIVTVEPIPAGKIGRAYVFGICPVQVDMQHTGDQFADLAEGRVDRLKSGGSGIATILWVTAGSGLRWALVRLGGVAGTARLVKVTGVDEGNQTLTAQQVQPDPEDPANVVDAGEPFTAYPWFGLEAQDYQHKGEKILRAEAHGGNWYVQLMDRDYYDYPDNLCDGCTEG